MVRQGISVEKGADVEEVHVTGRRTHGVRLTDGREFAADMVVCNADPPTVYEEMLPGRSRLAMPGRPMPDSLTQYSMGLYVLYFGTKRQYPDVAHHTIWLGERYQEHLQDIFDRCAIGDLGTIAYFQFMGIAWPVWAIMSLAIFNGLMTSIILETIILSRQMMLKLAFKTAIGMSLISMIGMEVAMNVTDVVLTGGAVLTWWVIPIMLAAGFITPLPYNYWRLKALGKACH